MANARHADRQPACALTSESFFSTPSRLARTMWSPNLGMMQAWRLYHSAAVID